MRIDRGQLTPAEPALRISLSGSVRAWLCKPLKTALSPTVPVAARATAAVSVAERHIVGLDLTDLQIDVPDVDHLGPARALVQQRLKNLGDKLQADLNHDLAAKRLVLDDLLAPATVSKVEAKFAGTALIIEAEGTLSKEQAATLLTKLAERLHTP